MLKSKLPPCNGFVALRQVNPYAKMDHTTLVFGGRAFDLFRIAFKLRSIST